ncbi:Major Facilitator Superfamily protein [Geodermatophilus saharensis]|uniref:Major Facilitator Superfamily protein n=1 Tax=Geodermatophilus saharensis TaxID=1137994 RepID=A0A238ZHE0_9ACTN|nr:MFS transporter [Geodermatophilus saharensis]SNR82885.1 Major Facilitator Superfamily protein [Geodermatophilus saharensis]
MSAGAEVAPPGTASLTRPTRPALLVLTLSLGVTTLSLLQSLVVPVLGPIGEQLGVSSAAAGWVLTANLLAAAVLTPVLGRLGDVHGERPVVLGILTAVAVGTLLAIVTRSLPLLLVARVLQGSSYGLFPLSISLLRRELPPARLSVAMSIVSSTLGVGGVVGLVAAGLLTGDGGDYHRPFWVGLGVTLVSLALAAVLLPRRPATATGGVDWAGAGLLGIGLVLLLLPVSQGNAWGWTSPATLGCAAGAVAVLTGWVLFQRRRAAPLVRPALLADPRMLVPNLAGLATGVGLFVSFLVVMQYVQTPPAAAGYGFGAPVLEAAVVYLLPGGVLGIALAPVAGRVVDRVGALLTLLGGSLAGVAGFVVLAVGRAEPAAVVVAGLLTQAWVTVAYAALPTLVVSAVRRGETGVANAVNSIARSVGQAVGSTVTVALLGAAVDPATGFPRASSFTVVSLLGAGAALVVALVSLGGMARTRRQDRDDADDTADVGRATACAGEWSPVSGLR